MHCALAPNHGMGSEHLTSVFPPLILNDNLDQFAFYDRVFVDGHHPTFCCGAYEKRFFGLLVEAGFVEVRDDLYDETDLRTAQGIFTAIFNAEFKEDYRGGDIDFADDPPLQFEQKLFRQAGFDGLSLYLMLLGNYCAMRASAKLRCPFIGKSQVNHNIQCAIREYAAKDNPIHDAVFQDPLRGAYDAFLTEAGVEIEQFPLSINLKGDPARPLSAMNQEVGPEFWPDRYDELCIDSIESERRLQTFLRLRRAPYFREVQAWLAARKSAAAMPWKAEFLRDWAAIRSNATAGATGSMVN